MSFTLILYFHKYIFRPISIRTALTLEIKMALMVAAPKTVYKMNIFIIGTHNPVIIPIITDWFRIHRIVYSNVKIEIKLYTKFSTISDLRNLIFYFFFIK